jgi:hypothetical protein
MSEGLTQKELNETELLIGYFCGLVPEQQVQPGDSPFFIHGFRCGRDDAEVSAGIRKFPSRDAKKVREDFLAIQSMMSDDEMKG